MKILLRMTYKKQIYVILVAIFSNQSTLGAIFVRNFREFAQIFRDFAKVFTDFVRFPLILPWFSGSLPRFHQIKAFWGALAPPPPTPLSRGELNPELQFRKAGTQYTLRLIGVVPSIDKPWLAWEKHFFEWLYKSLPCMFVVRTTAECRHFVAWNFMTGALTTPNAINSVCKFEGLEKY